MYYLTAILILLAILLPSFAHAQEYPFDLAHRHYADAMTASSTTAVFPKENLFTIGLKYDNTGRNGGSLMAGFFFDGSLHVQGSFGMDSEFLKPGFLLRYNVHKGELFSGAVSVGLVRFGEWDVPEREDAETGTIAEVLAQCSYMPGERFIVTAGVGWLSETGDYPNNAASLLISGFYRTPFRLYIKSEAAMVLGSFRHRGSCYSLGAGYMGIYYYAEAGYASEDVEYNDVRPSGLYARFAVVLYTPEILPLPCSDRLYNCVR